MCYSHLEPLRRAPISWGLGAEEYSLNDEIWLVLPVSIWYLMQTLPSSRLSSPREVAASPGAGGGGEPACVLGERPGVWSHNTGAERISPFSATQLQRQRAGKEWRRVEDQLFLEN